MLTFVGDTDGGRYYARTSPALEEVQLISRRTKRLAVQVRQLAHELAEDGVGHGYHVVLFAPSRPEWMVACLGIFGAGVQPGIRMGTSHHERQEALVVAQCGLRRG